MNIKKRFLSAAAAAMMVTASLPMYSVNTYAAIDYEMSDYVWDYDHSLFYVNDDLNDKVIAAIEKATGKDYDDITFTDLEKVTNLNLSGMELEGVPGFIQYMHRLRTLNLSENRLRSADVNKLDLSYCIYLTSVDVSDNYLTSVPSWFVSLDLSKKDISNNLIATTDQRSVDLTVSTYYFMKGDEFKENEFKDKILSTMILSDGTELPDFFYDPELPTYDIPEDYIDDEDYERNYNVEVDLDVSKFIKDGIVSETGSVTGTAGLFTAYSNENTSAKFKLYFLDGNDPSSVKIRLETLIQECESIKKEEYTSGSWAAYEAALKTAKTISEYTNADTDMLKNALNGLNSAKNDLKKGVSTATKKVLNDLITISKTYKEENYSTASWKKFQKAVAALTEAVNNTETSIENANLAIKAFQKAQSELTATLMSLPETILKSEFEAIYGEDKVITAKGVTREGYKYTWEFNGNDVTLPADFNPEIKYESEFEEKIRFEVGSASDYQLFKFEEKGTFPGTALITLDVSGVYDEGTYRLYKFNTSTQKSEFVKEVEIEDGEVSLTVNEGGDYFISSVLQNFQMISSNFNINNEKLTISGTFKKKYTAEDFRKSLENGEAIKLLTVDGDDVMDYEYIATGMTATAPGSDVSYTIVIPGDCDGDGNVALMDALLTLKAAAGDETALTTYAQKAAADVTGNGWIYLDDSLEILKHSAGIE